MATQIGPKIGIEGEKEYRAAIQQIIQQTKNLDSAMEKTASEWTKNTSEMTKNRAIAQNLVQQINAQKQKLEALNDMLQKSVNKYGESATATMTWQRAVDNATVSLNHMQQQLESLNGAQNFSVLSTQIADVGTKMQNIGQSLSAVGQRMTMAITLPLVAAGTAAVKLASDTEEARNKVEVVFGSMAESVKQFAADALNSYGLAEGSALQMAGTFGAMASAMGMSQSQAASMSIELTALAADMASFYNVSTEVAQTSLQSIFTGETEALKKFGIVMSQTNLETFAEQQGKIYSQMSEAEKVMTRYAFVIEATKDAQGDFSRTSDGTANSIRVFKESLKQLASTFGEELLPIITPIIQDLTALIKMFSALPESVKKVIVVVALVAAAMGPLIMIIGGLMSSFNAIVTSAPMIITAFSKIGTAIAAMAAAIGMSVPQLAMVILIIAAIAGVAYAIADNWDAITAAAEDMAQGVQDAFSAMGDKCSEIGDSIGNAVNAIVDYFKELPKKIGEAISEAGNEIKREFEQMIANAKKSGRDFIDGFVDGIKNATEKVVKVVKDIAKTIQDFLGFSCPDKGPLHEYESWMPDFMMGLAKGIRSNMGVVKSAINGVAKEMSLPLSANASMNMALSGAGGRSGSAYIGGTTMNVYVDHISELNDLIRIQNQAQQRYRMGAR